MNKTIKINPNLLMIKPKKEKEKRQNGTMKMKNFDDLKRQLLKKSQQQQPAKAVDDSINFFVGKKKNWVEVNLDNPDDLFNNIQKSEPTDDVPYGCLKRGTKPTFRDYHKMVNETRKNRNPNEVISKQLIREQTYAAAVSSATATTEATAEAKAEAVVLHDVDVDAALKQDLELNKKLKEELAVIDELKKDESSNIKKTMIRKTINKKYTLGKNESKRTVAVLIKNADRKNEIIEAKKDLQQTKMNKVKSYLIKHNLLKKSSQAPLNVVLDIFKNARLTGDVYNVNFNTLIEAF